MKGGGKTRRRAWQQLALDLQDDSKREFERLRKIVREQQGRDDEL